MKHLLTVLLLCSGAASAATAQDVDSAAFIVRLGTDTTAIERYVRTSDRLVAEAVTRAPSTRLHRLTLDFAANGDVARADYSASRAGDTQPLNLTTIIFAADSTSITTAQSGTTRSRQVAAPAGAIPLAGPFYAPYELAIMRAVGAAAAEHTVPLLAGGGIVETTVRRSGRDTVVLNDQFGGLMTVHSDASGRLLHLHTPSEATVERLRWIELDPLIDEFAARDESGRGLGMLSPYRAYRAQVEGANLWVDYSAPSKRGRTVFGGIVPWNEVWRTGANQATHFATDRELEIGEARVPPGTYTLFTIPAPDGWTLIINRETGQGGLDHDPAHDLARVPLRVERVDPAAEQFRIDIESAAGGGVLAFVWMRRGHGRRSACAEPDAFAAPCPNSAG
ncbi:MAG: DUF2911 domain-containing protein [Longimicrobiales bacterium]